MLQDMGAVGMAALRLPHALRRRGCGTIQYVAEANVRYPVLLVHGYAATECVWTPLRRALGQAGFGHVVSFHYNSFAADPAAVPLAWRPLIERRAMPGIEPIQFALADVVNYGTLIFDLDVKPLGGSLLIVFAYRDAAHFDYAHLSVDPGMKQPVHNGIFHVYGGERVRISSEQGPAAFAASGRWYHVKLTHDATTGSVSVTVDGRPVPALEAVDRSLGPGKCGFGSFDETGEFKNVKIVEKRVTGELWRTHQTKACLRLCWTRGTGITPSWSTCSASCLRAG